MVRYLQVDSSPQAGLDYLNMVVCVVRRMSLPRLLLLAHLMKADCLDLRHVSKEQLDAHTAMQAEIRLALFLHRPPTVLIGMGKATLGHKLSACAHGLRTEEDSFSSLATTVSEFHSFSLDFWG